VEDLFVQIAGLQPLAEPSAVPRNVLEQPPMTEALKAGGEVALQDPFGTGTLPQHLLSLCQGSRTAPLGPEPLRVGIGTGCHDGVQTQQVQGLLGTVQNGWNAEGPEFAVAFRNVHPAQR